MKLLKLWDQIADIPSDHLSLKISTFLTSVLIVVPSIAVFIFSVYMGKNGFFSYDFFIDGLFGMKLFFLTTLLFLSIASGYLFIPLFFYGYNKYYQKPHKIVEYLLVFFWTAIWLFVMILTKESEKYELASTLIITCLLIAIYLYCLFFSNAKKQLTALIFTSSIFALATLYSPKYFSNLTNIGLKVFGMGGDLPIKIENARTGEISSGTLKLITPQYIYYIPEDRQDIPKDQKVVSRYRLNEVKKYKVVKTTKSN